MAWGLQGLSGAIRGPVGPDSAPPWPFSRGERESRSVSSPPSPDWPFPLLRSGRDRDLFDLGDHVLVVAADRLKLLSRLARFWFRATRDIVPNAMVSLAAEGLPGALRPYWPDLAGRSTLLRRVPPCEVRCAVHGCLTGAAHEEYVATGGVFSTRLPARLRKGARLSSPLFAPFLEDGQGRRRIIPVSEMADRVGFRTMHHLRERCLALFLRGYRHASDREIILADAEFTFGRAPDGAWILADEALTPGTSRYWSLQAWRPDGEPPRMDEEDLARRFGILP